jgi:hypothetical protein
MTSSTTSSTTLYGAVFQVGYNNGAVTTAFYTAPVNYLQASRFYGDGTQTLALNLAVTMPIRPGSGSTGGSTSNPPQNTCPAVGQVIMTKRGPVLAEDLRVGDYLLDWKNDTFNKIYKKEIRKSIIWEITLANDNFRETLRVDKDHRFVTPLGWWGVQWLQRGDPVINSGGGLMTVEKCEALGPGHYVEINCDMHRYRLGPAVGHNLYTGFT